MSRNITDVMEFDADVNRTSSPYYYGTARHVTSWMTVTVAACLSPVIVLGVVGNFFSLLVWVKGRSSVCL